jgi:hypothetical protein
MDGKLVDFEELQQRVQNAQTISEIIELLKG